MDSAFQVLSWLGVAVLTLAHVQIACGWSKSLAHKVSTLGGVIAAIAAAGLSLWSVVALNVAWSLLNLSGISVAERRVEQRHSWIFLLSSHTLALSFATYHSSEATSWMCSILYVLLGLLFALAKITREQYLSGCILVSVFLVPALWQLGGFAFAANEMLGAFIAFFGLWRAGFFRVPDINPK